MCIKCLYRCRICTCYIWSKPTSVFGQWVLPTAKLRAEWSLGQGWARSPTVLQHFVSGLHETAAAYRGTAPRGHGLLPGSASEPIAGSATLCNCKERRRTCWISRISANNRCVIRERPSGSEKAKSGPQIKDSACSFLSCSIFHGIGQ